MTGSRPSSSRARCTNGVTLITSSATCRVISICISRIPDFNSLGTASAIPRARRRSAYLLTKTKKYRLSVFFLLLESEFMPRLLYDLRWWNDLGSTSMITSTGVALAKGFGNRLYQTSLINLTARLLHVSRFEETLRAGCRKRCTGSISLDLSGGVSKLKHVFQELFYCSQHFLDLTKACVCGSCWMF